METATAQAIGQLSGYLRGLTQRLDLGTGWYGEFLRRDPQGLRDCLDGAAMPPWDVVESLLGDLEGIRGAELAAREREYAARLRAAAVGVWDRLPGGAEELRTLLAAAADQRSVSEAATRTLTARLGAAPDPAEAETLTRELAWIQDDTARAASRHEDLMSRLRALEAPAALPSSHPDHSAPPEPGWSAGPAPAEAGPPAGAWAGVGEDGPVPGVPRQRQAGEERTEPPVGRAEGRWLRGARRAGGARYAGAPAAAPAPAPFTPPPGHPAEAAAAPRGARFAHSGTIGRPRFAPPEPEHFAPAEPESRPAAPGWDARAGAPGADGPGPGGIAAVIGELLGLRTQGRGGEAHALLCEAAAWPAARLPGFADELVRAGLGADWATLLWEAASLPPERLAAAAAALGEAGRHADCETLLRQGAARPAAEIADAALALAGTGRTREADALLGAFVKVRTAEEAVRLARRDPQWFTPRLLRAAEALSDAHHRDLVHALRVAKPPVH
ncbi:hypothetical protein [Streptomyces sp. NRRL S-244]|uniref:hypothetical protein n=1 Tax=Streptomyces sp. NRRL S-244 TaxID=1463897 RepID=UPI0004BE7D52|nr:hypothetical protein [Streptomyces sp. NRRL S-244]